MYERVMNDYDSINSELVLTEYREHLRDSSRESRTRVHPAVTGVLPGATLVSDTG